MSPYLSAAHNLAWRKFLVAYVTVMEHIEQDLAAATLPPLSWYDVLFVLSESPGQKRRLHEIAEAVLLSRSNTTRLVNRLESAGLLTREQCSGDRRGAFAVITDDGLSMLERMWVVYEAGIVNYFAQHLDASEAKQFAKIMNRMTSIRDS
ncbi:MAG: MarR family transcriptional regulator [Cyanobacteria bacterium P01_E01_bin.6]